MPHTEKICFHSFISKTSLEKYLFSRSGKIENEKWNLQEVWLSRCILLFVNSSYSWPSKQKMPLVGTLIIYFWQKCFSWYWPTLSLNMKYLLWLIDHKNEKFQVPAHQERDSHCSASHIFWCCQLFQYLHLLCDWRQPVKMDCPWRTVCFLCASPV